MTREDAEKLIAVLAAAYPQMSLGESTVAVYADALAGVTFRDGQPAVARCIYESKWFPSISEILDRVVEATVNLPTAEEAWAEVQRAIGEWHWDMAPTYRDGEWLSFPGWSSLVVQAAVEAVGWRRICLSEEEQGFIHRDFVRAYEAFRTRASEYVRLGGVMPLAPINAPVGVVRQCIAEVMHRQAAQDDGPIPIGPAVLAGEPADVPF